MKVTTADGVAALGFAALMLGIGMYDWRIACIVGGAMLLAGGLLAAWRGL